ncbi:MAG: Phosphatidylcholine synthase [uncultured Truepera sp.]|uniref:Phosphatidylcholine synthase n=1 Tax=uncultured Truepera sp. TaxID=543023 RepID=A0A6J4VDY9_9DEIN|nr:MAG: Phosphatidylcholine synthase [uncultured Truepera sp.]
MPSRDAIRETVQGYLVHVYTASTLFFVALSAQWILEGAYRWALLALAVTIIIDATDGALARKFRVEETAAGIDGALLDNIIDFTSYVLLPMLLLLRTGLLAPPGVMVTAFAMFSSAFGFSRTTAKLADAGFFVGFPSYWSIVVFYLYMLGTPPLLNTLLILGLSLLVFVPVRFLYVSRLQRGRTLHIALGSVWSLLCIVALTLDPGALRTGLLYVSLIYPVFYTLHSLRLDWRSRQRPLETQPS